MKRFSTDRLNLHMNETTKTNPSDSFPGQLHIHGIIWTENMILAISNEREGPSVLAMDQTAIDWVTTGYRASAVCINKGFKFSFIEGDSSPVSSASHR